MFGIVTCRRAVLLARVSPCSHVFVAYGNFTSVVPYMTVCSLVLLFSVSHIAVSLADAHIGPGVRSEICNFFIFFSQSSMDVSRRIRMLHTLCKIPQNFCSTLTNLTAGKQCISMNLIRNRPLLSDQHCIGSTHSTGWTLQNCTADRTYSHHTDTTIHSHIETTPCKTTLTNLCHQACPQARYPVSPAHDHLHLCRRAGS